MHRSGTSLVAQLFTELVRIWGIRKHFTGQTIGIQTDISSNKPFWLSTYLSFTDHGESWLIFIFLLHKPSCADLKGFAHKLSVSPPSTTTESSKRLDSV